MKNPGEDSEDLSPEEKLKFLFDNPSYKRLSIGGRIETLSHLFSLLFSSIKQTFIYLAPTRCQANGTNCNSKRTADLGRREDEGGRPPEPGLRERRFQLRVALHPPLLLPEAEMPSE